MKIRFTLLALLLPVAVFSQTIGMSYKAIVRDNTGAVMANQEIRVDLTLNIVPINFPAYIETHMLTTNENGLMILTIGEGTPINGTFSSLDWLNDRFELNVQIDPGDGLIDMGSTPMYSVPYSYHAQTALSAQSATIATDVENIPGLEPFDEGNGEGWRLASRNPINYGPIGENAVDLSYSTNPGTTRGALGYASFAMGGSVASGNFSTSFGLESDATGYASTTFGTFSEARGSHSLAIGFGSESLGDYSFAFGYSTRTSTAADYGIAMGNDASVAAESGIALGSNTYVGAFNGVAIGADCSVINDSAFAAGYDCSANAIGSMALGFQTVTRANNSIAIGNNVWSDSYQGIVLGTYNTIIPASNTLFLPNDPILQVGNGTGFSDRSTALMVLKNGNVGVGTINPLDRFHIGAGRLRIGTETIEDTGTNQLSFGASVIPDANNAYRLGNSTNRWIGVWAVDGTINTSDRRDKENITELNYGLQEIQKLNPVSFNWKERPETGVKLGLIAQDLQTIIPEVVMNEEIIYSEDNPTSFEKKPLDRLGVYYSDLIPVLIKAIQEQQDIINLQKDKLASQGSEIGDLSEENAKQSSEIKKLSEEISMIQQLTQRINQLEYNQKNFLSIMK